MKETPWNSVGSSEHKVLMRAIKEGWDIYMDVMQLSMAMAENKKNPSSITIGFIHAAAHISHALSFSNGRSDKEAERDFVLATEAIFKAHLLMLEHGIPQDD